MPRYQNWFANKEDAKLALRDRPKHLGHRMVKIFRDYKTYEPEHVAYYIGTDNMINAIKPPYRVVD